jgi:hypothetical protein
VKSDRALERWHFTPYRIVTIFLRNFWEDFASSGLGCVLVSSAVDFIHGCQISSFQDESPGTPDANVLALQARKNSD